MRTTKAYPVSTGVTETIPTSSRSVFTRLLSFLRTPLYRNGYALVLSSMSTSALGMVYWVLAARLYTPEVVGINSALISAMMFLAAISQLNLNNGLIRFIRNAGRFARRFTLLAYVISIAVSGLACVIFLIGINQWSPVLTVLNLNPFMAGWFVAAVAAWCIFALQDGVLTGLRFAIWVPVENTIYSLVKIVLLVLFVTYLPDLGVFAAWTLGVVALILPTNIIIFRSLISRQMNHGENPQPSVSAGQVVKFTAADYLGGVSWMACTYLMPVIVATRLGSASAAYFYLAWTIANTLYLITPNIGSSLIAETSTEPDKVWAHLHRVFFQVASLVVPLALIVTLGAPLFLRVFGNRYSIEGTLLLRLLALSAIPNMVTALFVSVARSQQRRRAMVFTVVSLSFAILFLSFFLIPTYGILGVGIAFLAGQTVIAIVILATQSASWNPGGQRVEKAFRILVARFLIWVGIPIQKVAGFNWMSPSPSLVKFVKGNQLRAFALRHLPGILNSIPPQPGYPLPMTWTNVRWIPTFTDMQVYFVGSPGMIPVAVLKFPRSEKCLRNALREKDILEELHADPRLYEWHKIIPKVLVRGKSDDQDFLVEQIIPGITAHRFFYDHMRYSHIQAESIARITELHRRTATISTVGRGELEHWINEPLTVVEDSLASMSTLERHRPALNRLAERLHVAFVGCSLPLSWIHGDFSPGNILVTPDGGKVTGIVDWELAEKNSLPLLDPVMLLVTTRMILRNQEMGQVVRSLLSGERWTKNEQGFLNWSRQYLACDLTDMNAVLLLCWLQHVANNISKSDRFRSHHLWVFHNVETVLNTL